MPKGKLTRNEKIAKTMIGNQNARKLHDPGVKQEAFEKYLAHLRSGMPKDAFAYETEDACVNHQMIDKMMADNPSEFPPHKRAAAENERYNNWLNRGLNMMDGKVPHCEPAIYQMMMRNMFKWDRKEEEAPSNHFVDAQRIFVEAEKKGKA